ncbi:endoribonuclease L-PSP [Listeria fleischmannii subsp. coloradonensis]|uniref:RidA family protein n=2 Tax=Listeria fleischmannii TaxID=1069827 RepID=A0A841YCF0_9LIST|nr:endoribonuclease L-PSP [Listeria fleischmannii subsp. coloradonensis]MBC1397879.1 RidA family protein [Listeria fleischmannii]MBC1417464.1 RidA family protein [Listeria fleischmannii]MBC1427356.1 RidA family protein [Listeria fleischmannii]STY33970.1 Enamine/imine deaminase [Listeria fleischmannii subsp. coloradonensis]
MKEKVHSDKAPQAIGPYSHAVKANGFVFTSGQIGVNPETGELQEGIANQTKQVFQNLHNVLEEAGSSLEKAVKLTVFLKDLQDFKEVNDIYATYFTGVFPARSAFQVAALPMNALVEIEVVAEV